MLIPIFLALSCLTSTLYCSQHLVDFPYSEQGLVCSELRADCTDCAKSLVRTAQRNHCSVPRIVEGTALCSFCICAIGYAVQKYAPNEVCLEPCCKAIPAFAFAFCMPTCVQRCGEECCQSKNARGTYALNQLLKNWSESPTDRPTQIIMDF